jgi:hypothetical protein
MKFEGGTSGCLAPVGAVIGGSAAIFIYYMFHRRTLVIKRRSKAHFLRRAPNALAIWLLKISTMSLHLDSSLHRKAGWRA